MTSHRSAAGPTGAGQFRPMFGVAALFAFGCAQQPSAPPAPQQHEVPAAAPPSVPALPAPVAAALKWLPADSETVIVANGPFRLTRPDPKNAEDPNAFYEQESVDFVDLVRSSVFALAAELDGGAETSRMKPLFDVEFFFALEGSRRFRAPRNLGMMSYEGAFVGDAGEHGKAQIQAIVDAVAAAATEKFELAGTSVSVLKSSAPYSVAALYTASPRPGLLCVASDRAYLEALLERMAKPGATDAFPSTLPEWKHVDPTAGIFALRHFRRDDVENDPTSPFREHSVAGSEDPKAIGLAFECRQSESQTAIARYLTGSDEPIELIRRAWTMKGEGLDPMFEVVAPGVVEISHAVVKPLPASRFYFVLFGHLGHGIYV